MTSEEARAIVLERDKDCIARLLGADGLCRDKWGASWAYGVPRFQLEVDRVRESGAMGKSTSHSDPTRMVALCPGHHRGTGTARTVWATSKSGRATLRAYLERVNGGTE